MKARTIAAALLATAALQPAWSAIRTDRFILHGTQSVSDLRTIACEAQQVLDIVGLPRDSDSARPSIIAAANASGMRELLPQYWERRGARPLGGYWSGTYGHHIAIRADAPREERLRRLLHEIAHFATHLSHRKPPRWLDEGLSEIWESAVIEGDSIEVGRPVVRHVRALRSGRHWIPIAQLVSATEGPGDSTATRAPMFYAQSWALAHYLLFEQSRGTRLDRLPGAAGLPTDEQLRSYARGPMAPPLRIAAPPDPAGCGGQEVRPLSEVDSLMIRARALADGERPDAALPLLEAALRAEAGSTEALETLGFVHFRANRHHDAAAAFDQVIASGKGSHISYYYRALLAGPIPALSDGSGRVPEADYLRRAVCLEPRFQPARDRLRELTGREYGCAGTPAVPD